MNTRQDKIANKVGWFIFKMWLASMAIMLIAQWVMLAQRCLNGGC